MGGVFKSRWAAALCLSPFRQLLHSDPWFRRALLAFLALQIVLLLFLPKIWRATPRGFTPVIRISGLELFQAWKFQQAAWQYEAAQRPQLAADSWRLAWGHHPAHAGLTRRLLKHGIHYPETVRHPRELQEKAGWLLRLSGTNLVDLELAAEIFHRYDLLEILMPELRKREKDLPSNLRRLYLNHLFYSGQFPAFKNCLDQQENHLPSQPEIEALSLAYAAIQGPFRARNAARKKLESTLEQSPSREIARAFFHAAVGQRELVTCAQLLNHLGSQAPFRDHLSYWRLVAESGDMERAVQLAEISSVPPKSLNDLAALTQFYNQLHHPERALPWLEASADALGHSAGFWISYADQLIHLGNWAELTFLALRIRYHPALQGQLTAYSYFLEGQAAARLSRTEAAQTAFQRMLSFPFHPAGLGTGAAAALIDLGHLAAACGLLRHLEKPLAKDIDYWLLFFQVAEKLKDAPLMVETSANARALAPANPLLVNNHAAALLIQREQPELAVQLTLDVLNAFPESMAARMNHSAALILNQRAAEAAAWLRTIPTGNLTPSEAALYQFNWLQIHLALGQTEPARLLISRIEENWLYSPQKEWLRQVRLQLGFHQG